MKFSIGQISATVLAFTTFAQGAVLLPRQDATTTNDQNSVQSQYPNMTDIGHTNGTWYLTAISDNAYSAYQSLAQKMSISINCVQFNITASSNTSFDVLGSGFAENNVTHNGVNGTTAGVFMLQNPDSKVNVTDNELYWSAYFSQIYVNTAAWQNFTTGTVSSNDTNSSQPVPGLDAMQINVYSKFIDSTGNNNTDNADTIVLWGSEPEDLDSDNNTVSKRAPSDSNPVYAMILSRGSHVEDDTFNKTLGYLPPSFAQENITLVNLNDTCSGNQ